MRKALVKDGLVVNVIEIDSKSDWKPPEGHTLLTVDQSKQASPGDTWDGKKIIPQVPSDISKPRDLEKEMDAIKERLDELEK